MVLSVRDVTNRCREFQNGTRGLKAGSDWSLATRALEGPLFHGIIGVRGCRKEFPVAGDLQVTEERVSSGVKVF